MMFLFSASNLFAAELPDTKQEFLAPDAEEGSISSEPAVPFDGEKKNYSLDTNKSKAKVDQFDDLFKDDKEEKNDLPF